MPTFMWIDVPARMLMAPIFLISGIGKLTQVAATQSYMEKQGVAGVLLWPAAALELTTAVCLVVGFKVRPASLVLAGWSVLTAYIFHTTFKDPEQLMNFAKNMAMSGGFLMLAKHGSSNCSVDGWISSRRRPASASAAAA